MPLTIVLDTNCLLACAPRRSQYRWLYDAILNGEVALLVTTEIMLEYEEILADYYSEVFATSIINTLKYTPTVKLININYHWFVIEQDKDDNKFVDCAFNGTADYIITHDKHFKPVARVAFPKVEV